MSKSDLRKKAEVALNTMTKLRRDEEVSLTILSKICKTLNADFGDIVEYVPDAEIWDLYNENRELFGKDHVRGEQLPIDGYHLMVHVWIRNSKGQYLISQRSANRPTYPLMWECVGGSVVKGEDSLLGAIREAKEEVGVDLMPENGQVLFTKTRKIIEGKIFNDIMDVWCQTAHCGRGKPHFDFGNNISPIVRYRHLPQTLIGMTVDCCSLV